MMKLTKIFTVERLGYKPDEQKWVFEEMFCPHCGKEGVWRHEDGGDYYCGETHLCVECGWQFTIQGPRAADDWREPELAKLRS